MELALARLATVSVPGGSVCSNNVWASYNTVYIRSIEFTQLNCLLGMGSKRKTTQYIFNVLVG